MVPTRPQCLVLGTLNSCLVLDLLWVSYFLGENGISCISEPNVPNFHVGRGLVWHSISTALTLGIRKSFKWHIMFHSSRQG